jgi:hypothetical protein
MAVRPGVIGASNILQKRISLPESAFTPANENSAYIFNTNATTTIGSGATAVTVTKRTANNDPAGQPNPQNPWVPPTYDSVTQSMTFSGTQSLAYLDTDTLHVYPPYSCQVDFRPSVVNKTTMYIVNNGQGGGIGWEEFVIYLNNDNAMISTCAANNGEGGNAASGPPYTAYYNLGKVMINTWNRVGVMWYNVGGTLNESTGIYTGGTNYMRGYLNDIEIFTRPLNGQAWTGAGGTKTAESGRLPWNSPNGICIGNDSANFGTTFFQGSIRNFFIGRTLFWPI